MRDFFPEENNKEKEKIEEKNVAKKESDDYLYERQVTSGEEEVLSEITQKQSELQEPASSKPKRTIKIIAEKDIAIEERLPPNFSPNFKCNLHYPNSKYNKRTLLPIAKKHSDS
jgi:hypothetical protein